MTIKWNGVFKSCACAGCAGELISDDIAPHLGPLNTFSTGILGTKIGFRLEWTTVDQQSSLSLGIKYSTKPLFTTFALFTPFLAIPDADFKELLKVIGITHMPIPIGDNLKVSLIYCSSAAGLPALTYSINNAQYTLRNYVIQLPEQRTDECVLAIAGHTVESTGGKDPTIFAGTWFLSSLGVTSFAPAIPGISGASGTVSLGISA